MVAINHLIHQHPESVAWAFVAVNVLWVLFTYFNRQAHDRAMERLRSDLLLSLEHRKKLFELKVNQYEAYVVNLDAFGKKHQSELPSRLQPIFSKYINEYLAATESGNKEKEREVIVWFSDQISTLIQEGHNDVLKLQAESSRLKLTATNEMIETFTELERLTNQAMEEAQGFVSKFTEIMCTNDQRSIAKYQSESKALGAQVREKANTLLQQMRAELRAI